MEIIVPNKRCSSIEVIRPFDLFVCIVLMHANKYQLFAKTRAKASKERVGINQSERIRSMKN